jgi:hypothetical protein
MIWALPTGLSTVIAAIALTVVIGGTILKITNGFTFRQNELSEDEAKNLK